MRNSITTGKRLIKVTAGFTYHSKLTGKLVAIPTHARHCKGCVFNDDSTNCSIVLAGVGIACTINDTPFEHNVIFVESEDKD